MKYFNVRIMIYNIKKRENKYEACNFTFYVNHQCWSARTLASSLVGKLYVALSKRLLQFTPHSIKEDDLPVVP